MKFVLKSLSSLLTSSTRASSSALPLGRVFSHRLSALSGSRSLKFSGDHVQPDNRVLRIEP